MSFTFETVDVKQELVDQLKAELLDKGYTGKLAVRVIMADPSSPTEIPCIGINRVEDNESSESLSDGMSNVYDPATQVYGTIYGTFFAESMEIRIWHTNADERNRLYQDVRAILFANRSDLISKGLLNVTLRSGRDEQDSTMTQAPMVLYWATITMSYMNPLDVQFVEQVEPISAVPSSGALSPV